jgi:TonB family protein
VTPSIHLALHLPSGPIEPLVCVGESLVIGRDPGSKVHLPDASVSSMHAVIRLTRDVATLIDLSSDTGTFLNGTRVQQPVVLAPEDRIRIGPYELVVRALKLGPVVAPMAAVRRPRKPPISTPLDPAVVKTAVGATDLPVNAPLGLSVLWGDTVVESWVIPPGGSKQIVGRDEHSKVSQDILTLDAELGGQAVFVVGQGRVDVSFPEKWEALIGRPRGAPDPVAGGQVVLAAGECLAVKMGPFTVRAAFQSPADVLPSSRRWDIGFVSALVVSLLLHGMFVVGTFQVGPAQDLTDALLENPTRFAQVMLAPTRIRKRRERLSGQSGREKAKGEEGRFGRKDASKPEAARSKSGAPQLDPKKREKDRRIAMNSGLLRTLNAQKRGGAVSSVLGPGGLGEGINQALGGLRGNETGNGRGEGGLGLAGTGKGGGGKSLSIGGLGHGTGGAGTGSGDVDLGGDGRGRSRVIPGRTLYEGNLSRAEIDRVIRQNLPRFQNCYQRALVRSRNLAGKVAVRFTIAPTGGVAQANVDETSMGDAAVESCIVGVMQSLRFPKPRGGGIVLVTYPFVFRST